MERRDRLFKAKEPQKALDEWYFSITIWGPNGEYTSRKRGPFFEEDISELILERVSLAKEEDHNYQKNISNEKEV
jgi:hypothetical protein